MGGGELELPEPIIQRLQSFLTGKEAAQTTILSKSWRNAWLTRPNLSFDEREYRCGTNEFLESVKKTLQRYEDSNLNTESFRLCTDYLAIFEYDNIDQKLIANELIVKALKIGADDLTFQITCHEDSEYILPHEVFGSEKIVRLSVEGCRIIDPKVIRCSRLESLCLASVDIETDMISKIISNCPLIVNIYFLNTKIACHGELLTKLPSLKELTLHGCYKDFRSTRNDQEGDPIRVFSRSLERLNIAQDWNNSSVEFDVPSIRKFTFQGEVIYRVSFKSTSSKWESHLSIHFYHGLSLSWFRKLNKFLTGVSGSKIYLSLHGDHSNSNFDYDLEDIQSLSKKHEVEDLTMDIGDLTSLTCYALYDGLFRLCRPKSISQYLLPKSSCVRWKTNNYFLCKKLVQGMNGEFSTPSNFLYGLHDLEEVNVQLYDEVVAAWSDVSLDSLDASTRPKDKQKVRFQLKLNQLY